MRSQSAGAGLTATSWIPFLLIVGLLGTAASADAQGAATYRLVGAKSSFVAHLLKAGLGASFAHDHVIRARGITGTLVVDPQRLETVRLSISVDVQTLEVDPPELRRAYKMKGTLSVKDRKKVAKNMHRKDQLWTARYPAITFVSTSAKALGGGRYVLLGKLTIRGVTRALRLKIEAKREGEWIKGSGSLRVKQSSFGYKPYSAALGLVKVRDWITLDIYLAARRR